MISESKAPDSCAYLFHGLCRQHKRVLCLDTNAVFNPNAHPAEVCWVTFFVRYVEPSIRSTSVNFTEAIKAANRRFHSHALSRLKRSIPRLARRIMNIETDVVAEVVRQEFLHSLARHVETELGKVVLQTVFGSLMQFIE